MNHEHIDPMRIIAWVCLVFFAIGMVGLIREGFRARRQNRANEKLVDQLLRRRL